MKAFYISINGDETGPSNEDTLKDQISRGEIPSNALCWCERMEGWQPVLKFFTTENALTDAAFSSTAVKAPKRSILEGIILFLTAAVTLFLGFLLNATRTSLLSVVQDIHEDQYSQASIDFYLTPHLFNFLALAAIVPVGLGVLGCFRQLPRNLSAAVIWLVLSFTALYTMVAMYAFITPLK